MALFDLRKYNLKLEIEKPNNNWEYFVGDKINGKIILTIKKPFHSKGLTLRFVKESKITTKSKIDNKETINTKHVFLYNDVLAGQEYNLPNDDLSYKTKVWEFRIVISKHEEPKDYSLMKRFFDAFYPAKIENKYFLEILFDLPWPQQQDKITKQIKVIEKI